MTWAHDLPEEPVELYAEIDAGFEVRKVDVFGDGSMTRADAASGSGATWLSLARMPSFEEIAQDPEFLPVRITAEEFERAWARAGDSAAAARGGSATARHGIAWSAFVEAFGERPLVLPDGVFVGSTSADWDSVTAALERSRWDVVVRGNDGSRALSDIREGLMRLSTIKVRPRPDVMLNFFFDDEAVLFDIDLREITDQDAFDQILDVIETLGRAVEKDCVITDEGGRSAPVLTWTRASGRFRLGPSLR